MTWQEDARGTRSQRVQVRYAIQRGANLCYEQLSRSHAAEMAPLTAACPLTLARKGQATSEGNFVLRCVLR